MNSYSDERATPRFERDFTVFIEVSPESGSGSTENEIIICKSLNLSQDGFQVTVDRNLKEGHILKSCLEIKGRDLIFVVAEVIWTSYSDDSRTYDVGFKILDSKDTDFENWQQTILEIFSEQT